jgi:hypothetical protein
MRPDHALRALMQDFAPHDPSLVGGPCEHLRQNLFENSATASFAPLSQSQSVDFPHSCYSNASDYPAQSAGTDKRRGVCIIPIAIPTTANHIDPAARKSADGMTSITVSSVIQVQIGVRWFSHRTARLRFFPAECQFRTRKMARLGIPS